MKKLQKLYIVTLIDENAFRERFVVQADNKDEAWAKMRDFLEEDTSKYWVDIEYFARGKLTRIALAAQWKGKTDIYQLPF